MNIAIIGYGRMGKEIERISLERNHEVVLIIDENNIDRITSDDFEKVDIAIDFSVPESAFNNINLCFNNNVPIVSGTTGWLDKLDKVIERCTKEDKTFFYASNYSIGVNIFFKLNEYLAKVMNMYAGYDVEIEETHHTKKVDAPSGTAITLAEGLIKNIDRKGSWEKDIANSEKALVIKSIREGNVPGNHKIMYESEFDKISIEHDAKSRVGFALGAVLAAEYLVDKKGYHTMDNMLKI